MSAADDGARGRGKKDQSGGGEPPVVKMGRLVGRSDAAAEEEVWESGRVVLGLYEVEDELGRGGMGVVHKVRHRNWNHWMAVKSPLPRALSGPGGKEDFVREAELWVNLPGHPNIVTCHYVRTIAGIPRIFAEYVDGGSLRDRIGGGRLRSLDGILDIAIQMAWGLALAHGEGLVHQDMKPGNVMLTSGGAAKITDFGLARARARAAAEDVAADVRGDVAVSARGLTKEYASPEQMAGERLSGKTDMWSWAVTVLDMFEGGVSCELGPAAGWTLEEYLKRGAQEGLPAMPEGLAKLLRRCFFLEPDERPGDFDEIAEALRQVYCESTGEAHARQVPQKVDYLADGLNNRALSMMDLGKVEEAEKWWEIALESNPTHPESTYNAGLVRWRSGRVDDLGLVQQLEECCEANEGNWLPRYLLALVHLERDDTEKATATLEAIPDEDSEREEVARALEQAHARSPGLGLVRTFEGHRGRVMSACLSADGGLALSGSSDDGWKPTPDNTLKLWDVETAECLGTFEGHEYGVNAVCLRGRYALSGGDDKTLKLWDTATGNCLRTLKLPRHLERDFGRHWGPVLTVCLSQGGRLALAGNWDGTVTLWNVATGECLSIYEGHTSDVYSVCFSQDGMLALSGSKDTWIRLWDLGEVECLRTFKGEAQSVNSVCLSADGRHALSGSNDNTVKLWDPKTGKRLRTFQGHSSPVSSVCLSVDGVHAVSGSHDGTIRMWDVTTGKCIRTFMGHGGDVTSVCLSADGRHALTGSGDKTLKLWQVALTGGEFVAPPHLSMVAAGETASQREITFQRLLSRAADECERGDFAQAARLIGEARGVPGYERSEDATAAWSALYTRLPRTGLRAGWLLRTFEGHKKDVNSVCLSADGRQALSGSDDKTIKLWDVATGECLRTLKGHRYAVDSVYLSTDGRHALSGSYPKTIKLWDVSTGECLCNLEGHRYAVTSVCLSADGRHALSGSWDKTLRLWEVATGHCLRTFEGHKGFVHSVCLSADGRHAFSGGYSELRLWEVATGKCLRTFEGHKAEVTSVCLSGDERYALSGGHDKTVKLWDVATGSCLRTFEGHEGWVTSVCLSADGRYAVSGNGDNTLRLWDAITGHCLRAFEGDRYAVESVCLSAEATYALSGGDDNTLKLWFLDWELEGKEPADWDEGARPYLEVFLTLHTAYLARLPQEREPSEEETTLALTRGGRPQWTEADFQHLLHTLGCASYGWLRPEGVRSRLEELANSRE